MTPRDNLVVVLHRPQRLVNIAGVVRAMKNMGLHRLRLVAPVEYEPFDIAGIAHRSEDLLAAVQISETLDDALADCVYVVGTTARPRGSAAQLFTPRSAAAELLQRASYGPVALLFGPEDNGLTNADLDRCHALLHIPTTAEYASLNLAQAVLIVCYELLLAHDPPPTLPAYSAAPATAAQLERLFHAAEHALWSVEFFKAHLAEGMMRSVRSLVHRAQPTAREAALLTAMCLETINYLRRSGRS
ncbi:MAG TPA: RNA methyltransferase [Roseiflexaceae bacterium]|nr:RNA methyltransferase [Roseiflexaceae bacterium]HMP42835.1 RNA methyltransferase [Roseiflexaceae bacterium]